MLQSIVQLIELIILATRQLSSGGTGQPKNRGVLAEVTMKIKSIRWDNRLHTQKIWVQIDQGHYIQFFINEQSNAKVSFWSTGGKLKI